jgi:class 3 adenylate cyclase
MIPDVQYARTGGVAIAYQVAGDSPDAILYSPHLCTIEALWRAPHTRRFLDLLTAQTRLIVFNPRGMGLSDRPRGVTLESRMDDINAVLDAAGVERVTLFGVAESGNACALYASTYPERCDSLCLFTPYATVSDPEDVRQAWVREMREHWGERAWMEAFSTQISPEYMADPELMDWFVWMQRAAASPAAAAEFARMQMETDITDVLPTIKVPTVVMFREQHRAEAESFARPMKNVELLLVSGTGADPYSSAEEIASTLVDQARRETSPVVPESLLATLLFTDLTDSTTTAAAMGDRAWRELLEAHHADVRRELVRFRGVEVDSAGDGFFCRFDGPARAIACAQAIVRQGSERDVIVRAGLHTGECELVGPKPAGIAVHIGARVLAEAEPGEILVSSTVKDLVAGSDLTFTQRGEHQLKGVPDTWTLYRVNP